MTMWGGFSSGLKYNQLEEDIRRLTGAQLLPPPPPEPVAEAWAQPEPVPQFNPYEPVWEPPVAPVAESYAQPDWGTLPPPPPEPQFPILNEPAPPQDSGPFGGWGGAGFNALGNAWDAVQPYVENAITPIGGPIGDITSAAVEGFGQGLVTTAQMGTGIAPGLENIGPSDAQAEQLRPAGELIGNIVVPQAPLDFAGEAAGALKYIPELGRFADEAVTGFGRAVTPPSSGSQFFSGIGIPNSGMFDDAERAAREAEIARLSQEWMATMGTQAPNPLDEALFGEAPIGGSAETGYIRRADLPPDYGAPPPSGPTGGFGEPSGGTAGRMIDGPGFDPRNAPQPDLFSGMVNDLGGMPQARVEGTGFGPGRAVQPDLFTGQMNDLGQGFTGPRVDMPDFNTVDARNPNLFGEPEWRRGGFTGPQQDIPDFASPDNRMQPNLFGEPEWRPGGYSGSPQDIPSFASPDNRLQPNLFGEPEWRPGGFAGSPVSYGSDFTPSPTASQALPGMETKPVLQPVDNPATTLASKPLTTEAQAQARQGSNRFITRGLPEEARSDVEDFITVAREQIQSRPHEANLGRNISTRLSGNVQSPRVDEMVHQESQLNNFLWGKVGATELDEVAAKQMVDDTMERFRKQMLDETYGSQKTQARLQAEETLRNGDRQRALQTAVFHSYDNLTGILRQLVLTGDVAGALGQQGLRALRGSPSLIAGLANRLMEAGGIDTGIWRVASHKAQMMADGVPFGRPAAGLTDKPLLSKIPVVGPALEKVTTAQFGVLDKVRALSYEGQMLMNHGLHEVPVIGKALGGDVANPQVRRNIGRAAATVGSSSRRATGAARAAWENRSILSAPMTRAQFNEALQFFQNPMRPENRLAAANLVAGTALTVAAGKQLHEELGAPNSPFSMDPLDPDFGWITTKFKDSKGQFIRVNYMPQGTFINSLIDAAQKTLADDPKGAVQEMTQFAVGRLNVLPSKVLASGLGIGYGSEGFETGGMSGEDRLKNLVPAPIGLQDSLLRGESLLSNRNLANQAGLSNFPESSTGTLDRLVSLIPEADRRDWKGNVVNDWYDLSPAQRNDALKYPEIAAARTKQQAEADSEISAVIEDNRKALSDAWQAFQQGGPNARDTYTKTISAAQKTLRDKIGALQGEDYAPSGEDAKLVDRYFKEVVDAAGSDYELRDRLETEFRAQLPPEANAVIDENLLTSADPNYAKLKAARSYIEDKYWSVTDREFERIKAAAPANSPLKNYETYSDVAKAAVDTRKEAAAELEVAKKVKSSVDSAISDQKILARRNDPKADALLYIYGYIDTVVTPAAQQMVEQWAGANGVNMARPPLRK